MRPDRTLAARLSNLVRENKRAVVLGVAVALILFPFAYSLGRYMTARVAPARPFLERPAEKYTACVRDTTYMRFHHMDLLKQVREQVIRNGQRGEIRLSRCRECHTQRARFCNQCHNAVSLHVDCFGCHYYPETL